MNVMHSRLPTDDPDNNPRSVSINSQTGLPKDGQERWTRNSTGTKEEFLGELLPQIC